MLCDLLYIQCFDAVGWAAGRPEKNLSGALAGCWRGYLPGVRCRLAYAPADATATHRLRGKTKLDFTEAKRPRSPQVKSSLVLPFWYRLTLVVPGKGPLNGCVLIGLIGYYFVIKLENIQAVNYVQTTVQW